VKDATKIQHFERKMQREKTILKRTVLVKTASRPRTDEFFVMCSSNRYWRN